MSRTETVVILSDSYLNKFRIATSVEVNKKILDISPHITGKKKSQVNIVNLATGGQTIQRAEDSSEDIANWIQAAPSITVIHLGACEIINQAINLEIKDKGVGQRWIERVIKFIEFLKDKASQHLGDNYQQWIEGHKFVLCQLPDWQQFVSSRENSLSPSTYRTVRKNINKSLKGYMSRFWDRHRILVVQPRTANDPISGVHLSQRRQFVYNKDIFNAVARLLCSYCCPQGEHSNSSLQEQNMCSDRRCKKNN